MHEFDYNAVAELRSKFIPYGKVEEFINPVEGDVILDIGAGDGFYSVNFSQKIGRGRVISLEIDERGADLINRKIAEREIGNIEVVIGDACSDLDVVGFNKVFFSNTFHDLDCREDLLEKLKVIGDGELEVFLIEFKKKRLDFGPPEEIRLSEEELKGIFLSHGFKFMGRLELSHHYLHSYIIDGNQK